MTNTIIFDSEDYQDEFIDFIRDELSYFLDEYVIKGKGETVEYGLLAHRSSHYGSIGGNGQVGFKKSNEDNLVDLILNASPNSDRITVENSDGELLVNYHDHDGIHHITIKRITPSKQKSFNNKLENGSHDEIIKYLDKLPSIKTKTQ